MWKAIQSSDDTWACVILATGFVVSTGTKTQMVRLAAMANAKH